MEYKQVGLFSKPFDFEGIEFFLFLHVRLTEIQYEKKAQGSIN